MDRNSRDVGVAAMPTPPISEKVVGGLSGWAMAALAIVLILGGAALLGLGIAAVAKAVVVAGGVAAGVAGAVVGALVVAAGAVVAAGLTPVTPGEARVVQLLGRYTGTLRTDGLRWVNPLTMRRRISTRIRNHETAVSKVNDADGNPIEIAAVVVWQVEDTAKAMFGVDDVVAFVAVQSETAVRHIAGLYPYDGHGEDQRSLRENAREITAELADEITARVAAAGVHVIESRITRLAYAPEIAQAMLRRQQASAVVAARQRIVEGAVGMVESALSQLASDGIVELDDERRAAMVSNMLVVLCSDHATQPVVNTGTLYQ